MLSGERKRERTFQQWAWWKAQLFFTANLLAIEIGFALRRDLWMSTHSRDISKSYTSGVALWRWTPLSSIPLTMMASVTKIVVTLTSVVTNKHPPIQGETPPSEWMPMGRVVPPVSVVSFHCRTSRDSPLFQGKGYHPDMSDTRLSEGATLPSHPWGSFHRLPLGGGRELSVPQRPRPRWQAPEPFQPCAAKQNVTNYPISRPSCCQVFQGCLTCWEHLILSNLQVHHWFQTLLCRWKFQGCHPLLGEVEEQDPIILICDQSPFWIGRADRYLWNDAHPSLKEHKTKSYSPETKEFSRQNIEIQGGEGVSPRVCF